MTKVLKDFRCKVTKRVYRAGDEYDGERVEELQVLGYVSADEDVRPKPGEKHPEAENNEDVVIEQEENTQEAESDEVETIESTEKPAWKRKSGASE